MHGKPWTQEQTDILRELYADHFASEIAVILDRPVCSIYVKAQALGLKSSPEKIRRSGYVKVDHQNKVAHQFPKGHVPDNKGKKMSPEVYARCAPTMFKKGQPSINRRPVGSERVNIYGYIEIKVAEPNKWRLKHRVIWEQIHGPIPPGHNVQFRNHNRLDVSPENLYLISRRDQFMKENSIYAQYPPELQYLIKLKGALNRQIHKIEKKDAEQQHQP